MSVTLFSKIKEVISGAHGWCSYEKAKALAGIILATRPRLVVEIGVWSGKSLLPMALACKEVGVGKVIGIDPYSPQASVQGQTHEHAEWWGKVDHEGMWRLCNGLVDRYGVRGIVELKRERSDDTPVPEDIGLLHVDGNHGEQALRDVARFAPAVVAGGFVVLDDLHWDGGGVTQAAGALETLGFRQLFAVHKPPTDDWGVFQGP